MYLMVLLALVGASSARHLPQCVAGGHPYLMPHETDCSKYYFCSSNYRVDMICPSATLFDIKSQDCIEPEKANCNISQTQSVSTMIQDTKTTAESPKTWTQAARRTTKSEQNAQMTTKSEQNGQMTKISEQNAQMTIKSEQNPQMTTKSEQNAQMTTKPICGQGASFEAHPESSRKYYVCFHGSVISVDYCDQGMTFDPILQECSYW